MGESDVAGSHLRAFNFSLILYIISFRCWYYFTFPSPAWIVSLPSVSIFIFSFWRRISCSMKSKAAFYLSSFGYSEMCLKGNLLDIWFYCKQQAASFWSSDLRAVMCIHNWHFSLAFQWCLQSPAASLHRWGIGKWIQKSPDLIYTHTLPRSRFDFDPLYKKMPGFQFMKAFNLI